MTSHTADSQLDRGKVLSQYQDIKPALLDIARTYAESGLSMLCLHSALFSNPLKRGKVPTYTEWQTRILTADELFAQIEATYQKEGGANLGVKTGRHSALVCVDCDGPTGRAWFEENKIHLGQYVEAESGKGGLHLFYRYPTGIQYLETRSAKKRVFDGVDILADGQGQAVVWPSIHPETGRQYSFRNGLNLLDVASEADELPRWIADEVLAATARDEARKKADPEVGNDQVTDADVLAARELLATFPPAIQGQGGDSQTFFAALKCKDKGLSARQIYEVLRDVYNPRCVPPWPQSALMDKAKHAWKYGKRPAGVESVANTFPESAEQLTASIPSEPPPTYAAKYPVVSAATYLARNPGVTRCARGQIYRYNAGHTSWEMIDDPQFESVVMADVRASNPETYNALKMDQVAAIVKAIKRKLEGENPNRQPEYDAWVDNRPGEFIACRNGILNIETGELIGHTPAWFSFTVLPFDYNRSAECPAFEGFLDSVWGNDDELKESLRLWMGYMLVASMKEQKFAVLHGASRGGKGTLARVVEALVGKENVAACSIHQFGKDFGMEHCIGKRLAIFNDAEKSHGNELAVATERLKSITGNDTQPIPRKNKVTLTLQLKTKVILVCNELPPFLNDRGALTNRMIAFPFVRSFKGQEDQELGEKLSRELPGILNWALRGSRRLLQGARLQQSTAGAALVEEFVVSLDPVRSFVRDVVRFNPEGTETFKSSDDIFKAYTTWCQESGVKHPKSKDNFHRSFAAAVRDRAKAVRWPKRGYVGIDIDSSGFPDDDIGDPPF